MMRKTAAELLMTLRELSPDFDEWPKRWMGLKENLEYGRSTVGISQLRKTSKKSRPVTIQD